MPSQDIKRRDILDIQHAVDAARRRLNLIDLHVHTHMSDGTLSPKEVVIRSAELGLKAIAITDHDTIAGIIEACEEGKSRGVEIVPGVEISTDWSRGILHVLGYFIRLDDNRLLDTLSYLNTGRKERIPRIIAKLADNNVRVALEDVNNEAVGGVPGRPHVAQVMVHNGTVRTVQEAFDRFLRRGAPAYVEKTKLSPTEAIRLISGAGGIPVLAHPHSLNMERSYELPTMLQFLVDKGLQGIESYYPRHSPEQTRLFLDLAFRFNLAVTGGTDFHGANKPEIKLGHFPGQQQLPYSLLESLKERLSLRESECNSSKTAHSYSGRESR